MKYSLRVNHKSTECGNTNPTAPDDRDNQFKHIEKKRGNNMQKPAIL
jgi:hypothetical protein